jgi:hypothetical protein
MRRRLRAFALFLTLVACISACGGSSPAPLAASDYIAIAMQSSQESWDLGIFPKTAGTEKCVLHLGPPEAWIPGSCRTSVTMRGDDEATVRFTERWKARDFFAGSPGKRHLSHTWEITVSGQAADDRVVQSRHYGDFPPQLTR